jgi:sigma-B regulation protein RsbU (phosphoserine phosphatase)
MTTARAFLRERIQTPPAACAAIISDVNKRLVQDVQNLHLFMTMFYCELDARQKSIHWVKAGHEPAILWTPSAADSAELLAGKGVPLGIMDDAVYEEYQKPIRPGQIILIGTDGIKEAVNQNGEMYGNQRLLQVIKDMADQSSKDILDAVFESLDRFCQPLKIDDDATLVVIKVQ